MVRVLGSLVVALVLASMAVGAVQTRPVFTGLWKFVGEQGTPPDHSALGKEFRITQEANALVLEVPVTGFKKTRDGKSVPVDAGLSAPLVYTLDGKEHTVPFNPMVQLADGSSGFNYIPGGPYRAAWKANTLEIVGTDTIPYTSFTNGPASLRMVPRALRTAFSLATDGLLLVERTIEQQSTDQGAAATKVSFRSVYRKAS